MGVEQKLRAERNFRRFPGHPPHTLPFPPPPPSLFPPPSSPLLPLLPSSLSTLSPTKVIAIGMFAYEFLLLQADSSSWLFSQSDERCPSKSHLPTEVPPQLFATSFFQFPTMSDSESRGGESQTPALHPGLLASDAHYQLLRETGRATTVFISPFVRISLFSGRIVQISTQHDELGGRGCASLSLH